MASAPTPSLIPVLTELAHALGHLLARGKLGWECFDVHERSLGVFASEVEAVAALVAAQQPEPAS